MKQPGNNRKNIDFLLIRGKIVVCGVEECWKSEVASLKTSRTQTNVRWDGSEHVLVTCWEVLLLDTDCVNVQSRRGVTCLPSFQIRVSRNKQRGLVSVDWLYNKQLLSPKKVRSFIFFSVQAFSWTSPSHVAVMFDRPSPPRQADLLDVVGVLYVGGLPQNYTTKRVGPVRRPHFTFLSSRQHIHFGCRNKNRLLWMDGASF